MGNGAADRGSLVGRDRELRTLARLLDDARGGRGHIALVLGEPGIGKSALLETLAATAAEQDVPVVWGRCSETDTPAFWPWRQVLRKLGADALTDSSTTDSRAELFARVVEQLAAAELPALLALEDLHWADPASLALLRFVADAVPGLPLLVVATARDDPAEAGPETTTMLRALPAGVERLALSGLSTDAICDVVAGELGDKPDEELAARIADRCGGNPFFVREVARLHASRGADATLAVPAGVRQVLERRFARLSQPCRDLLAAAAVADEPEAGLLAAVLDEPRSTVLHRLGEAITARLLHSDGTNVKFAHALVREALYAQLAPSATGDLHRRVAEVLDARHGDAARRAAQWRRATGEDAHATAAVRALAAAREARERMGYEQAVLFYRWALEAPPEDDLMLRIEFGEAQALAGMLSAGRDTLREAAREALRDGRWRDVARATLGIGIGGFEVALRDDEQVAFLDHTLSHLTSPQDDRLRAAVLARLSVASTWQRAADARAELADESAALARSTGDASTEVAAHAAWCDACSGPDHTEPRLERSGRMIDIALRSGDPVGLLLARRLRLVAHAERGEFDTVDAQVDEYARTSDRLRLPLYAWPVPVWRGARALMSGDMDAARRWLADAQSLASQADSANAAMMAVVLEANLLAAAGERDALTAVVDKGREVTSPHYGEPTALAYFYALAGRADEARRMLLGRVASGVERPRDSEYLAELWLLGETAVVLGRTDAATVVYDALRPYGGRWAINGIFGMCLGQVAHVLGRLAGLLGERDEAHGWLRQAREAHAQARAALLVAQTDQAMAELTDRPDGASATVPDRTARPEGDFQRSGRVWYLRWDGSRATVPDMKGMHDLAALLAVPGREVHVLDLIEAAGGPSAITAGGHTGERLDKPARDAYRQRLADIEDELAEADAGSDAGRADRLRREQEFIAAELAGALGLGGRPRTDGDPVERARKAVTMRIRTALKAIGEVSPALARHLDRSVTTGRLCAYRPEREVRWRL